jgi:uncharacterized protein
MIIQLTIENFKSFLESATLDFASGTASRMPGNLLRHQNGERFVKSMALYGPNASGKTTVLDGLYALRSFIDFSSHDQKPTSRIPEFEAFALDQSASKRPTRISLTIDLGSDRYTVDVSATTYRVWNETLKVQHMTKKPSRKTLVKTLIERTWKPKKKKYLTALHEDLGTEMTRSAVIEQTTPNRLMLGKLASMNSEIASRIIEWFDDDLEFYDMHRNIHAENAALTAAVRLLKQHQTFAAIVARFMKDADTGIQELRVVDEEVIEPVFSESDKKLEFRENIKPGLAFRHVTSDGSEIVFRRQQESSGTLRFVALLAAILQPSTRRRLVCIDELSASMHPDLIRRLIRIVHSSDFNPLGNQLLFTTHDTHLMDPTELLRRDQITLCSKNRFGRSTIKRLDAFHDAARSDANLQKQYLDGRFGGIPQFGPTLEDVPVDDDPLEVCS